MLRGGCVALIVAAGRGSRFGPGAPKQYRPLAGRPVLRHTVDAFLRHPAVDAVRVVIHADDTACYDGATAGLALLAPITGGASRQDSVRLGLESLSAEAPGSVLIHDAARPLVAAAVLDRVTAALAAHAGAIPALPVVDTLKRAAPAAAGAAGGAAGAGAAAGAAGEGALRIDATVARDGLWRAQTPQAFRYAAILAAHRACAGLALTDDAAVAEHAGLDVALVAGEEDNLKITTEADLARAHRLLDHALETRTATGFDVHRFCEGDHVMLCGVAVPHDRGLLGHSDADVGLHALTDALLGTLGEGDIGSHFPPSDPQWRGAASDLFLRHAGERVAAAGGRIVNLDVTLICERPKVGRHREAMRRRIAEILGIAPERVSVKATTTEQLGFTGRREGIAAQAAAAVRLPAPD